MSPHSIKKIHLVFKTHLDIGFTALAGDVVCCYFEKFIPAALASAKRSRESADRFVWTTGSWLIYEFLEQAAASRRREMEDAICHGDIRWHALPATVHSELMDASLFDFGLSLAAELDARFDRKTIAAKMTDVPGHTLGLVPIMARRGVTFLHLGVNPASRCPEVPGGVVRWRASDDQELLLAYSCDYGSSVRLEGFDEMLYFAHTLDNLGPPSNSEISGVFQSLRREHPEAEIVTTGGMDGFAAALEKVRSSLPVFTAEIGDAWIHGTGSDPGKMAEFRALQRWRTGALERDPILDRDPQWKEFSRLLLMVAEHTWGRDMKDPLPDSLPDGRPRYATDETMETQAFLRARRWGRYCQRTASWQEQQDYLKSAREALRPMPLVREVDTIRDELQPECWTNPAGWLEADLAALQETPRFLLRFDAETGALVHLESKSTRRRWADTASFWGRVFYEVFDASDYRRYVDQYLRDLEINDNWVWHDYGKPGLEKVPNHQARKWLLKPVELLRMESDNEVCFSLKLSAPEEASGRYGCPRFMRLIYRFPREVSSSLTLEVQWTEKQACRIPEAIWLSLSPKVRDAGAWRMSKLGRLVSPLEVVAQGARRIHGVEHIEHPEVRIIPLDAPLVAPGAPRLLDFAQDPPDLAGGWHFPLFNNVWGTNFPQWNDKDARFRFEILLHD